MERIVAPILANDHGSAVRNLQDGLMILLTRNLADANRQALLDRLSVEQRDAVYGPITTKAVAQFQSENREALLLHVTTGDQVDEATAAGMNQMLQRLGVFERTFSVEYIVTGRVEFADGHPAPGLRVNAFDRDLGPTREPLGDARHPSITGPDGRFPTLRYRRRDFANHEGLRNRNADLIFTVTSDDGQTQEISAIFRRLQTSDQTIESQVPDLVLGFVASPVEDVRIVLARASAQDLPEYGRLMRDLAPLLITTPADFDQERFRDIDFSAREIGWDRALIATMQSAWQLAITASPEPQLLAEMFYGLLREGPPTEVAPLPATLPELLDQSARWPVKLRDSLTHRIIGESLDQYLARLRDLQTKAAAQAGNGRRGTVADVLTRAGIPEAERLTLLTEYHTHTGSMEDFWGQVVPQRLGWSKDRIAEIQSAFQFADLVAYDLPLVQQLQQRGFRTPRDLVKLARREWVDLIRQLGPPEEAAGDSLDERVSRTVDSIASMVDATFPTDVMAQVAVRSADEKLVAARDLLARFFQRETEFDIAMSPVTSYLETHAARVFQETSPANRSLLTGQLQRLQRVFRLGVDREQSEALLALNLDSAFRITRFSPEHFVTEFGDRLGGKDRALSTYGRAETIAGTILYIYTDLWTGLHAMKPMALKSSSPDQLPALKEVPAYHELFGSLQMCECGHCQSFYSPAAYFVDLLHMLDRPALAPDNPADVLFERRPDLAHIQLTCENTNTLIPYVDLVTEVLESWVANRAPKAFNIPPPPPNQKLPSPSAEELRVNPVYLTAASSAFADAAYAELQEAVFPLTLPLNLPLETTRAYLGRLGTSRAELMPLLDRDPGLEPLMARASETLLLSPEDFEIISGSAFGGASSLRPATTPEFFGLTLAPTPATLFNHAEPEFVRNPAKPDERKALIRSLQNILSIFSPPPIPSTEYGRYDTLTEASVNAFLTKSGLIPNGRSDAAFWGAMDAQGKPSLSVLLCPVPMFLDRSGLTYAELIALVKSRFVNPAMQGEGDFDYLARLGIPTADVRAWIEAGFPPIPAAIATQLAAVGETPAAFTEWVKQRADSVVINIGFEEPCDLDRATLMHLDGTLLSPEELVTLFRFIRIWKKLGWSLEETDHALEPGSLASAAVFQTILLLANVKQLRDRTDASIPELVCWWGKIPTFGESSLYDRLFRNRAAQFIHPVLKLNHDHTELEAAQGATPPALSDHVGTILAAFRLSAQDLDAVRRVTNLNDDPALAPAAQPRLNLENLSVIYRRVSLARALQISVRELLSLIELCALPVFERPDRMPKGSALAFLDLVAKVRASGVKVRDLDYLCRLLPRYPGVPGTQPDDRLRTLAAIRNGLNVIAAEEPLAEDPTGEALTARLTSILGPEDARAATALIYGSETYSASLVGLPPLFAFPAALGKKVTYDPVRNQLRCLSPLTTGEFAVLLAAPGVPPAVQPDFDRAVKSLNAQPRAFAARTLKSLYTPADAEAALIDVPSLKNDGTPIDSAIQAKVADILARRRTVLSHSFIKQTFATATSLPADVVSLLLQNASVLKAAGGAGPAMVDFEDLEGEGLDAEYYANPNLTGAPAVKRVDNQLTFTWLGAVPAPGAPGIGFSARWTGQIYVPAAGEITFRVRCTDGVRITINGLPAIDEWRDQPETEFAGTLRLAGAQFYPVVIEYYNKTGAAQVVLSWSSPSIPAASVPQAAFYTDARFATLLQRVERIYRLALLLAPFNVSAHDLQGLAEHGDIALDVIPLSAPVTSVVVHKVFDQWLALSDFSNLSNRFQGSETSLTDVLNAPSPGVVVERFVKFSGAEASTVDAIVKGFTVPAFNPVTSTWSPDPLDLSQLSSWIRIAGVLALVERTGAAPAQLSAWAKTREIKQLPTGPQTDWFSWIALDAAKVDRRATNAGMAQDAKNIVRARYDEEQWRKEARKLNDVLRVSRRSALTAFALAMPEMMRAHVTDSGRLFEYLLIDTEMDPCMETSRIKQGISSVQTFTQRILLDLESPRVPPARVDRGRWEWMKTYRVWEANRKVLLYAESYTEESLRDDKTPFFKELESEILQDELNDATAESAFRHYLEKLDGVAKLSVCGACVDSAGGVLHVFARTATAPFVFYHRRLDNPSGLSWAEGVWSPWQKLPVDVSTVDDGDDSGAHLMPILWNRRLYLFWPLFEQKPDEAQNPYQPEGFDQISQWHIKLAWSEYKDGKWSPKQTGVSYLSSGALIRTFKGSMDSTKRYAPFVKHYDQSSHTEFHPPLGAWEPPPGHPNYQKFIDDNTVVVIDPARDEVTAIEITDDPFLNGTKLEKPTEWATHRHQEETVTILSLLPKPCDHYLDAQINSSSLTIKVFCRFSGMAKGQTRVTITDTIAVVRDGRRSDRKEDSQKDSAATSEFVLMSELIGNLEFPACNTELAANPDFLALNYYALERPLRTANWYMAFRHERNPLEMSTGPLCLTAGADPILKSVPIRFNVIDSDNRGGFNRSIPFFYQDQQRCYLVIREKYARLFETAGALRVEPNRRSAALESAIGIKALADRQGSIVPDASMRTNPWARAALVKWSDGPGPALITDVPASTRSGSLEWSRSDLVNSAIDLVAIRAHPEYLFLTHWHPFTCPFLAALNSGGLPSLFTLENQSRTDVPRFMLPIGTMSRTVFETVYRPDRNQVQQPYPLEDVDFRRSGAYSKYNWELFFHAPMTLAMAHSRAGRYERALPWFHFVFDPMTADPTTGSRRFWRFLPFRENDDLTRIDETIGLLTYTGTDPAKLAQKANLQASIQEWLDYPFNPHILARRRPVIYMKYVFMKYLDNLIAWADDLFQRDTIESINEATQLYILAANLLGPRPERAPAPGQVAPKTYQELRGKLDELSDVQVDLETRLPFTQMFGTPTGSTGTLTKLPQALYFCLPQNENMLAYWDTIADRLFKIRHCMNLDGTVRQLPLFEPAIDPMLLVEAVAHGLDIGSVLNDLYAPLPRYRFTFMLQQALALCNEVRTMGNTLLSVLEKRDAEKLALLRAGHETELLAQVKANKRLQIDEAEQARLALDETARLTNAKFEYYDNLIAQGLISEEADQLGSLSVSNDRQEFGSWIEATAHSLNLVPNVSTSGDATFGGSNLGSAASAVGRSYASIATSAAYRANRSSITGLHTRRAEEWRFQRDQAKRELSQIERQRAASRIRKEIAQGELRNHETQIEHSRSIEEVLRTKFTNEGLYGYLEGSLRTVYFQCYKAAYDRAKSAERAWRYAVGAELTFVKYGAWDSSVRGLLAGETLYVQLKQMERAYLEQQTREFEITRQISVLQLDPLALIDLKESGICEVEIPEWLFDLDYPGHYFRRLKSVSLTIPAVAGPYTSVNATLTLLNSKVRESSRITGNYGDDENYRPDHLAIEAVAASSGQNDSGRFQLDFRDEKFLPFEGAGAISRWRIELPRKFRLFDYDTISDVILHLKYTSRRDEALATPALAALEKELKGTGAGPGVSLRVFSLRHEFPNEWQLLRTSSGHKATFAIPKDRFPFFVQGSSVTVQEVHSALILKDSRPTLTYKAKLSTPGAATVIDLDWSVQPGRYRNTDKAGSTSTPVSAKPKDNEWQVQITQPAVPVDLDNIKDILIVFGYSVAS